MDLTQEAIRVDWNGEPLAWGHTYLLVDHATVILYEANDDYELKEFLKANYPEDVERYHPKFPSQWMETLSYCTTTPEYHVANRADEIDANTEISRGDFEAYNSSDELDNDKLKEEYL